MDERCRADQDRGSRGVRVPAGHQRAWTGSVPASSRCSPRCMFAMFDLTASLLVLLGFLIFRWAVIAAPILGTVGLLRPASAGLRRLGERGRRRRLQHRHLRHRRGDLPVRRRPDHEYRQPARLAAGGAGLALRRGRLAAAAAVPADHPARRQGQHVPRSTSAGSWHRRFFRDMREAAKLDVADAGRHPRAESSARVARSTWSSATCGPRRGWRIPAHSAGGAPRPGRTGGRPARRPSCAATRRCRVRR